MVVCYCYELIFLFCFAAFYFIWMILLVLIALYEVGTHYWRSSHSTPCTGFAQQIQKVAGMYSDIYIF